MQSVASKSYRPVVFKHGLQFADFKIAFCVFGWFFFVSLMLGDVVDFLFINSLLNTM